MDETEETTTAPLAHHPGEAPGFQLADVETPEQIVQCLSPLYKRMASDLIKGEEPTDKQLVKFLWRCAALRLDPFLGHVTGIIRKGELAVQTTVEGYGVIAERTELLVDISEPEFDVEPTDLDKDGKPPKHPNWAKVVVTRLQKGKDGQWRERKVAFTARYSDFYNGKGNGFTPWDKMPWHMLGLRAEGHALKKAFRLELAGIGVMGEDVEEAPIDVEARRIYDGPTAKPMKAGASA